MSTKQKLQTQQFHRRSMTNILKIDELVSLTKCEALLVIRKNHKYHVYQSPASFAPSMNDIVCVGIRRWQAIWDVLGAELIASASGRYLHVSPIGLVAPIPTVCLDCFSSRVELTAPEWGVSFVRLLVPGNCAENCQSTERAENR